MSERFPARLRGAAALADMLNLIGNTEAAERDPQGLARIFCDSELDIREVVRFVIASSVEWDAHGDDPVTIVDGG